MLICDCCEGKDSIEVVKVSVDLANGNFLGVQDGGVSRQIDLCVLCRKRLSAAINETLASEPKKAKKQPA